MLVGGGGVANFLRVLPTLINFMHKLAVLEGFSFSRLTGVNIGKRQLSREVLYIYDIIK